jgi:hypothetical protein
MCDFDFEDFLLGYLIGSDREDDVPDDLASFDPFNSRHQVRLKMDNFPRRRMKRAAIGEDGRPEKHPTRYGF